MQSNFENIDSAIHPDRLSLVDHGARDSSNDFEPGEIRDDVVAVIKTEPVEGDMFMLGYTSTQDTLSGNTALRTNSLSDSAHHVPPYCLDMAECSLLKLESELVK